MILSGSAVILSEVGIQVSNSQSLVLQFGIWRSTLCTAERRRMMEGKGQQPMIKLALAWARRQHNNVHTMCKR